MSFFSWLGRKIEKASARKPRAKGQATYGNTPVSSTPPLVLPIEDRFMGLYPRAVQNSIAVETREIEKATGCKSIKMFIGDEYEGQIKTLATRLYKEEMYVTSPPVNPYIAMQMYEGSAPLQTCISAYTDNIFGEGFRIARRKDAPENKATLDALGAFFGADEQPGERGARESIILHEFKLWLRDVETTGTGYLELVMDDDGRPASVKQLPSLTIRELVRSKTKLPLYMQMDALGNVVYFKDVRDSIDYDSITGKPYSGDGQGNKANPVIRRRVPSPKGDKDGRPRWWGERHKLEAYHGGDYSMAMFYRQAPFIAGLLKIMGIELDEKGRGNIERWFAEKAQGVKNHHTVLMLDAASDDGSRPHIEYQKLSPDNPQGEILSAGDAIKDALRYCWRMSRLVLGQETNVNKASAATLRRSDEEQAFGPTRLDIQALINRYITNPLLGLGYDEQPDYFIVIEDMNTIVHADSVETAAQLASTGAATIDEIRAQAGLSPLPDKELGSMLPWVAKALSMPAGATPKAAAVNEFLRRHGEINE